MLLGEGWGEEFFLWPNCILCTLVHCIEFKINLSYVLPDNMVSSVNTTSKQPTSQ